MEVLTSRPRDGLSKGSLPREHRFPEFFLVPKIKGFLSLVLPGRALAVGTGFAELDEI